MTNKLGLSKLNLAKIKEESKPKVTNLSVFNLDLYENRRFPIDFVINQIYNEYQSVVNEIPANLQLTPLISNNKVNFMRWEGVIFYPKENVKTVHFALNQNDRYPIEPPEIYLFGEQFKIFTDKHNKLHCDTLKVKADDSQYYSLKQILQLIFHMVSDEELIQVYQAKNKDKNEYDLAEGMEEKDDENKSEYLNMFSEEKSSRQMKDETGEQVNKMWTTFFKESLNKHLDEIDAQMHESNEDERELDKLIGKSMEQIELEIILNKQLEEELNMNR